MKVPESKREFLVIDEVKKLIETECKVLNSKLNKLKRIYSEAFYYWAQVDKLLASCQNEDKDAHLLENKL